MSLLSHADDTPAPPPRGPRRGPLLTAMLAVTLVLGAGAWWLLLRPSPAPAPELAATPPAAAATPAATTGSLRVTADVDGALVLLDGERLGLAPQLATDLEPGPHRVRVERFGYRSFEERVELRAGAELEVAARLVPEPGARAALERGDVPALRVTSDVTGASVFVDRRFVGKTPAEVAELDPGPHRINVSAEGYEMYAEDFDYTGKPRTIEVRFQEVRLDESVAVKHRRTFGDREGILSATPEGIRFESEHPQDSFAIGFDALERFEMDYLDDDLRVKIRGGRNYNFTSRNDDPEELFVFHEKVQEARERLAR